MCVFSTARRGVIRLIFGAPKPGLIRCSILAPAEVAIGGGANGTAAARTTCAWAAIATGEATG